VSAAHGAELRRQIRLQQRNERLRNLWRLLVFIAIAGATGYALLRYGWLLTSPGQVEAMGSRRVDREQVIQAARLRFPSPLLSLQPQRIAQELEAALPVEQVQVSRLMAPPRLRVTMVDRQAVARAQRRDRQGLERGFVDRLGNWMDSRQTANLVASRTIGLSVLGWQPHQRKALALVLEQRRAFGSDLQQIRFEANGDLWLRSASLGQVRLGEPDGLLPRRLAVLRHLIRELPGRMQGQPIRSIDLSDPEQPEVGLAPPRRRPAAGRHSGASSGRD